MKLKSNIKNYFQNNLNDLISLNGCLHVKFHPGMKSSLSMVKCLLCLGPTAAMTFIVLGDEIWSPQIHRPKFVARAFSPIARIQF